MQSTQTKAPVEPDPAGPTPRPATGELGLARAERAMSAGALSAGGTKKYTVVRGAFVSSLLRVIVVSDP